jgi:hypothetical protein
MSLTLTKNLLNQLSLQDEESESTTDFFDEEGRDSEDANFESEDEDPFTQKDRGFGSSESSPQVRQRTPSISRAHNYNRVPRDGHLSYSSSSNNSSSSDVKPYNSSGLAKEENDSKPLFNSNLPSLNSHTTTTTATTTTTTSTNTNTITNNPIIPPNTIYPKIYPKIIPHQPPTIADSRETHVKHDIDKDIIIRSDIENLVNKERDGSEEKRGRTRKKKEASGSSFSEENKPDNKHISVLNQDEEEQDSEELDVKTDLFEPRVKRAETRRSLKIESDDVIEKIDLFEPRCPRSRSVARNTLADSTPISNMLSHSRPSSPPSYSSSHSPSGSMLSPIAMAATANTITTTTTTTTSNISPPTPAPAPAPAVTSTRSKFFSFRKSRGSSIAQRPDQYTNSTNKFHTVTSGSLKPKKNVSSIFDGSLFRAISPPHSHSHSSHKDEI